MTKKIESDRPANGRRKEMARDVVSAILDESLPHSVWYSVYPGAHSNLLQLRIDLELSVLRVLERYDA